MTHYNIPLFIPHLGCPFQCIFCNQNKIASAQGITPAHGLARIVDKHLVTMAGAGEDIEAAFFGGSFTAISRNLQEEYLAAMQPYLKSGRISGIRISTRPDFIDRDILDFLSAYGVKTIELGAQSMADEVLRASGRGYDSARIVEAARLIRSRGFKLGLQLMVGLPADNYERDLDSAARAAALNPDMVRIYPTLVIAATPLARMFEEGNYLPLSLSDAIRACMEMFLVFQAKNIDVIRMGLQPDEELRSPGTVIAGPFHPAFGEMVEQEVFREQAAMVIGNYGAANEFDSSSVLMVNRKDISKMTGNRKSNLEYLRDRFNLPALKVKPYPELPRNAVALSAGSEFKPHIILTRKEFLELRQLQKEKLSGNEPE